MKYGISRWGRLAALAALLLSAVAWTAWEGRIFAPAALSAKAGKPLGGISSHNALAKECGACHAAPWGDETMDARCLRCHTDVQAEVRDSTTLHGSLGDASKCRACHTEHNGTAGTLTRMDASALDHAQFGFSLETHRKNAAGTSFTCSDCHERGSFAFDRRGCESCHREYQASFINEHVARRGADCRACHDGTAATSRQFNHATTSKACITCHARDDKHRGSMGEDCAACHGTETWAGARFDHTFPISHGARRDSECSVCHQDAPRDYKRYTCYGCHEHAPARIDAKHREEGVSARELPNCVRCHATGREHEGEGRERHEDED